jgi:hypothetical protein
MPEIIPDWEKLKRPYKDPAETHYNAVFTENFSIF